MSHTQRIILSGASGLIGTALRRALSQTALVEVLVRRPPHAGAGEIEWDPANDRLDPSALEACDAVVHLSGANVAEGRWTAQRKVELRESRVRSTELLARTLAGLQRKPHVFVSASAIGIYGMRGDDVVNEQSAAGTGFLAALCQEWEAATCAAAEAGIRVVNLRVGAVLSRQGGALKKMLTPARFGLLGRIGSGRQWMSWISMDDLVAVINFCLNNRGLTGPINGVGPNPITQLQFVRGLGKAVHRPEIFPLPAAAVRLLFGEMGEALLLSGARVLPSELLNAGFQFRHPDLDSALHAELA